MAVNATPDDAPIGVVVAMESELQHLLNRVTLVREVADGPWLDRFVNAGDVSLIALCCGIGMVNAAAGAEHLIGRYALRAIFNYGCAGAHRRDILPGDVIIGDGTVHHGAVHILASGDEFFPGRDYEVTVEATTSPVTS
jgi:nucleoside phosphorylase